MNEILKQFEKRFIKEKENYIIIRCKKDKEFFEKMKLKGLIQKGENNGSKTN